MQKRRSAKLYQQWVRRDSLPAEEVPQDLRADKSADVPGNLEDVPEEDFYGTTRGQSFDSRLVTLPTRYVLTGLGIIALLLIILAVLSTILITQSC